MGEPVLRTKLLIIVLALICFTSISIEAIGKDNAPKFIPPQVTVPIGETKTIKLKNQADQNFSIGGFDDTVISVIVDKATREITISGLKTGETILVAVNDKGIFAAARVVVRKLAGNVPYNLSSCNWKPRSKKNDFLCRR
jgi:hypothetical protein